MFVTRDAWKAHLRNNHHTLPYWECMVCTTSHEVRIFSVYEDFLDHMASQHARVLLDVDVSQLLDACAKSDPIPVKTCPLCISEPQRADLEPEALLDHIGDHLHEFALESLPWFDSPNFGKPGRLSSVAAEKITHWFETIIPNVSSGERYPAYPSEETVARASFELPTDVDWEGGGTTDTEYDNYFAETAGGTSQEQRTELSGGTVDHQSESEGPVRDAVGGNSPNSTKTHSEKDHCDVILTEADPKSYPGTSNNSSELCNEFTMEDVSDESFTLTTMDASHDVSGRGEPLLDDPGMGDPSMAELSFEKRRFWSPDSGDHEMPKLIAGVDDSSAQLAAEATVSPKHPGDTMRSNTVSIIARLLCERGYC